MSVGIRIECDPSAAKHSLRVNSQKSRIWSASP